MPASYVAAVSLPLARFDFVAAEILLGLDEQDMLAKLRAVLAQRQLVRRIHRVLGGVINALTRFLADEADKFALFAFLCHIGCILTDRCPSVN